MKSLKEYSMNLSEADYHAYPAWSHSLITRYIREGFASMATIHEPSKPTPAMEFGSLFDSILTRGKDTLKEYVVDTTGVNCPPAEKEVFDKLIELGFGEYSYENLAGMHMGSLVEVMNSCESFCSKYKKEDTKFANLAKNQEYYELHRSGKKVVSKADWDDAVEMARRFRSSEFLNKIFGIKNANGIEYIYQAQFVVELPMDNGKTVKYKIMPDLLIVNHNDKTIRPVDLKTSAMPAFDFKENFLKYRYDIQAASYTDVLQIIIMKDDVYKDYTILPFYFTDISRVDMQPVTYWYDPHDSTQIDGFSYRNGEKEYKHRTWTTLLGEMVEYDEEHAVVPNGIKLDEANDLMALINRA